MRPCTHEFSGKSRQETFLHGDLHHNVETLVFGASVGHWLVREGRDVLDDVGVMHLGQERHLKVQSMSANGEPTVSTSCLESAWQNLSMRLHIVLRFRSLDWNLLERIMRRPLHATASGHASSPNGAKRSFPNGLT